MDTDADGALDKIDYISKKLCVHIERFEKSARWYQNKYYFTSMAALILSAFITVISGWKRVGDLPFETTNVVLVLGVLITVLTGWGLFFSPRSSWLICATTLNRLRSLRSKIEFMSALPSTAADGKAAAEIYDEYQEILDAHNKAWLALRSAAAMTPVDGKGTSGR